MALFKTNPKSFCVTGLTFAMKMVAEEKPKSASWRSLEIVSP